MLVAIAYHQFFYQMGDGPEQKQYGGGTQYRRHGIHTFCHCHHIAAGKVGGKATYQNKYRVAGRVTHFALKCLSNEFRAVPETRSGLYGEQIGDCCHHKHEPTHHVVD